jgi:hypothetical protein
MTESTSDHGQATEANCSRSDNGRNLEPQVQRATRPLTVGKESNGTETQKTSGPMEGGPRSDNDIHSSSHIDNLNSNIRASQLMLEFDLEDDVHALEMRRGSLLPHNSVPRCKEDGLVETGKTTTHQQLPYRPLVGSGTADAFEALRHDYYVSQQEQQQQRVLTARQKRRMSSLSFGSAKGGPIMSSSSGQHIRQFFDEEYVRVVFLGSHGHCVNVS